MLSIPTTTTSITTTTTDAAVSQHEEVTTAAAVAVPPPPPPPVQQPPGRLNLPPPPTTTSKALLVATTGGKRGAPLVLKRQTHTPEELESHAQLLSERLAEAALLEDDEQHVVEPTTTSTAVVSAAVVNSSEAIVVEEAAINNSKNDNNNNNNNNDAAETSAAAKEATAAPKKKEKKKHKKKKKKVDETPPPPVPEQDPVSTTDALQALPAQEVSITASTQVKIARTESSVSLGSKQQQGGDFTSPSKILPDTKSKSKKKKGKALSGDAKSNQKAARRFNQEVRACVENSDPVRLREVLHDRHNHKFALDANVLETVMKAFVVAAMFEDALYCLRNCTMPATLQTSQTERILTCMPQNLRSSNAYAAADMINALTIATEFDSPTARTYFLRIVRGIALEFLEEALSARDRICSAPCERLVRSAVCVVDSRLKRGKKPADIVVWPGDQLGVWQADGVLDNRGIQAGDAVSILPYAGPYPMSAESLDRNMIEATVTNTNPMVLRLQDKTNAELFAQLTEDLEGNVYRIDKLANRMGFNRQLAAAVSIAMPLGDTTSPDYVRDTRRPCPQLINAITAMDENIDQEMRKSSSHGAAATANSTAALCAQAIPWNVADETEDRDEDSIRAEARLALEKYGSMDGLNASQQLAVEGATSNRLTLVQGPPGTGETHRRERGGNMLHIDFCDKLTPFSLPLQAKRKLQFEFWNTGPAWRRRPLEKEKTPLQFWPHPIPTLRWTISWKVAPLWVFALCGWDAPRRSAPSCCATASTGRPRRTIRSEPATVAVSTRPTA